ncbi:MAG: ABC transporter ATP-binding protein [Deltaproteobacteria bacterium CG07_land_8_20_14_0_80_60_11]|nr:MAG: ABC transporter ATP-binding protein [Deltaproteobacteria bacterium CG07_land_8_20_14_0_80_60_11]
MSFSPNSPYSSGLRVEEESARVIPEPGSPLISFRGIHKSFGENGENKVLIGIDLEVYQGETMVILGRSGSGKTVLTSMLVGLNTPDAGVITVEGVEITEFVTDTDWRNLRLRTGYLFQGSALYDSMTVGENVAFPMVQHTDWSEPEIERRVAEKLGQVGLAGVEPLDPTALSGGMQRRAALARSLALDPQIIIYDEPTAGLDPVTGDEISRLIRRLQEVQEVLKVTSIVVTHDLRLTQLVADRLVLLHEGQWVFQGTYEEFLRSSHPEVRRFLHREPQGETTP